MCKQNSLSDRLRPTVLALGLRLFLVALFLGACGSDTPEQAQMGDGWTFLVSARADFTAPGNSAVLTAQDDLDEILAGLRLSEEHPAIDDVDFDTEVVLVLSGASPNPVFLDILLSEEAITVDQWQRGGDTTSAFTEWATLFAIDMGSLPSINPFEVRRLNGQPPNSIELPETS